MILNKYYIVNLPDPALEALLTHCVQESASKCRKSLDGTKTVIKLPVGAEKPPVFNPYTEYTHAEIKAEMATAEWYEDF